MWNKLYEWRNQITSPFLYELWDLLPRPSNRYNPAPRLKSNNVSSYILSGEIRLSGLKSLDLVRWDWTKPHVPILPLEDPAAPSTVIIFLGRKISRLFLHQALKENNTHKKVTSWLVLEDTFVAFSEIGRGQIPLLHEAKHPSLHPNEIAQLHNSTLSNFQEPNFF